MNTRQFLKSLPIIGAALFVKDEAPAVTMTIPSPPKPSERISFQKGGLDFEVWVGDHVWFQEPDGSWIPDRFGDCCEVLAKASRGTIPGTTCGKWLYSKGHPICRSELPVHWHSEVSYVVNKAIDRFEREAISYKPGQALLKVV